MTNELWDAIGNCCCVLFACLVYLAFRKPKRYGRTADGLDLPLYRWNKKDVLTVRDLVAGGLHAFGRTSSGKTSSLKFIAKAILKHGNSSMLVLCGKKGEAEDWLKYCAQTGRLKDVILFGVNEPARFNMIGYEAERKGAGAGQVANIVRFIMELKNVIFRQSEGGRTGEGEFWDKQHERGITHAVTILQVAATEITPQAIHDLIMSAPNTAADLSTPEWAERACNQAIRAAHFASKTSVQEHDFKLARDYFTLEWPNMADRTKASILVGIIGTLTAMNTGLARELFASRSTTNPSEQIEGRKIVIVDFPPDEFGDLGMLANIGLKWHWQREVLRRPVTNDSPIACIWGDESSLWVSDTDATYLSRCRSYRGCMVYICQSLDSYREALPGEKSKSAVEAMLANFSQKLFFALGDHATATWAADLCGKELQQFGGGGVQYGEAQPFRLLGNAQHSASFSEQFEYVVQPGQFLNGFRTGSPSNFYMVDALLVRSGNPFSNGLPIIRVHFDQRA